jgi:hypothetical protein
MKKLIYILFFVIAVSCKKDDFSSTGGYNCAKEKPVSADFMMGEIYGDEFIDLDTVVMDVDYKDGNPANYDRDTYTYVYFKANLAGASYEWQIGNNGIVKTGKEFSLLFSYRVGTIPVRLIVHKAPNKYCFPNDDGIDTVVRYLTVDNVEPHPLFGEYKGYSLSNPSEQFTIKMDTSRFNELGYEPNTGYYSVYKGIYNLPNGNTGWQSFGGGTNSAICGSYEYSPQLPYNHMWYCFGDYKYILMTNEYPSTYTAEMNFKNFTRCRYYPKTKKIVIIYWYRKLITYNTFGPKMADVFIGYKQ